MFTEEFIENSTMQLLTGLVDIKSVGLTYNCLSPDSVGFVQNKNQEFIVKLMGFGGSGTAGAESPKSSNARRNYCALEYFLDDHTYKVTDKSDVFSLGNMLVQLYAAKKTNEETEDRFFALQTAALALIEKGDNEAFETMN